MLKKRKTKQKGLESWGTYSRSHRIPEWDSDLAISPHSPFQVQPLSPCLSPTGRTWLCQFLSRVTLWKGSSLSRSYSGTFTDTEGPIASVFLTSSQSLRQSPEEAGTQAPWEAKGAVNLHWCVEFELLWGLLISRPISPSSHLWGEWRSLANAWRNCLACSILC